MWSDDYHDHYIRCENMEELEEFCGPLFLYKKDNPRWQRMWANIVKCSEMFGFLNVSLYSNDYMKYGDGIDDFLCGFYVNLKEADYDEEGYIELENVTISFENGFMFVRS